MSLVNDGSTRKCTGCGLEKAIGEFYRQKKGRLGRMPTCKDCEYEKNLKKFKYKRIDCVKKCRICNVEKHSSSFRSARNMPDGLRTECAECAIKQEREWNGRSGTNPIKAIMSCWRWESTRARNGGKEVPSHSEDEFIALLEKQNYKCSLTGKRLNGENVSIDHIIPVSEGGGHELSNLQLVDKTVNKMRGALSVSEFISLCSCVAQFNLGEIE